MSKPQVVTVEVKYERGHSYTESWEPTDYYCPECGKRSVWVEQGSGDYYQGPLHLCLSCNASGHLQYGGDRDHVTWQDQQRRDAIRKECAAPDAAETGRRSVDA